MSYEFVVVTIYQPTDERADTAVLGTAVLIVWQAYYGMFDNGDCFTITVAATVIAYLVAISMLIRYRWVSVSGVS